MSPRNKLIVLSVFLVFSFGFIPAMAQDPESENSSMLIRFYQDHISAADGGRCPMYPSCSEYAARAIKKHGPVIGWIMACDRLVRCGRDEVRVSPHFQINNKDYVSDPVSSNDFWWFNNKEKTERISK